MMIYSESNKIVTNLFQRPKLDLSPSTFITRALGSLPGDIPIDDNQKYDSTDSKDEEYNDETLKKPKRLSKREIADRFRKRMNKKYGIKADDAMDEYTTRKRIRSTRKKYKTRKQPYKTLGHDSGEYHRYNRSKILSRFRNRAKRGKYFRRKFGRDRASLFKDGYPYCDKSKIPSLSNMLKEYNSHKDELTPQRIEELKKIRLTRPEPCDKERKNPSHLSKFDMNLDDEGNLVPYINRCKVMGYRDQPDLFEYYGGARTLAAYMHVFKSGMFVVLHMISTQCVYIIERW